MKQFTVTKSVEFDYGHRIPNHASKCHNWHGHRAKVEVTVRGPLVDSAGTSDEGMVVDFSAIKLAMVEEIVEPFDHAFLLLRTDPIVEAMTCSVVGRTVASKLSLYDRVDWYPFGITIFLRCIPTAENLAHMCYQLVAPKIDKGDAVSGVRVVSVRFWETPTSVAEYRPNAG
jgi:6-pyruvoyltetrahydropterin/6-carboxytetrahydropterin synthase